MYGQGPFIPMVEPYEPEEEEDEALAILSSIPILGTAIGIGDDLFGDEEKKGKRDSVGSVARGIGDIATMLMGFA